MTCVNNDHKKIYDKDKIFPIQFKLQCNLTKKDLPKNRMNVGQVG